MNKGKRNYKQTLNVDERQGGIMKKVYAAIETADKE